MKKRASRLRRGNPKGKAISGLPRKVKNGYKVGNRVVPFKKLAKKWQFGLRKKWRKTTVLNKSALKYLNKLEGPNFKRGKLVGSYRIPKKDQQIILKEYGAKWLLKRQRDQQKAIDKTRFEGDFEAGYTEWMQAIVKVNKRYVDLMYFYH